MSFSTVKRLSRYATFPAPSLVRTVLSSSGRPLDAATRESMEPRFSRISGTQSYSASSLVPSSLGVGNSASASERSADYIALNALNGPGDYVSNRGADFSRVRIHTDSRAAESARALNAQAYTFGNNIVFGAGRYAPETPSGQKVLAHELAHVVHSNTVAGDTATVHRFTAFTPDQQSADESLGWQHPMGSPLRVADDGQMAVEDNDWGPGTNKRAWTTPDKIAESNDILTKQKSRAKLRQKSGSQELSGRIPDTGNPILLNEIEPFREGGGKFNLASDCGTAARQVTGSEPSGDLGAGLGAGIGLVAGAAGGAGIGYAAGGDKNSGLGAVIGGLIGAAVGLVGGLFAGREIEKAAKRKKDTAVVRGADGAEEELTARSYHGGDPTTPEEYTEELFKKEFGANLTREEAYAKYAALTATEKDDFDRKYGINKYAVPRVGQALTISTEKDMPGYSDTSDMTWNFHYAATVLRSGNDFVTLESAAGWDSDDWIFFMYGPESKSQSFHEFHGSTETHGSRYQTYVVQPEK
ncbi:MAG TPA: DUF4157 domain-containing protein [Pyrinomonadaceae bacterium]|nr:DUF4157 domain-containing protein [Pyrinomonadaceae bacterium]